MKNKISIFILLQVFIISGCDSEQKTQISEKIEVSKTEIIQQAAVPVKNETVQNEASVKQEAPKLLAAVQEPKASRSGIQVYKKSCAGCHAGGIANAPKLSDKTAWKPRLAKGSDALYSSALNGVPGTAMMKKGNCMDCSDSELKAAVDFMTSKAK